MTAPSSKLFLSGVALAHCKPVAAAPYIVLTARSFFSSTARQVLSGCWRVGFSMVCCGHLCMLLPQVLVLALVLLMLIFHALTKKTDAVSRRKSSEGETIARHATCKPRMMSYIRAQRVLRPAGFDTGTYSPHNALILLYFSFSSVWGVFTCSRFPDLEKHVLIFSLNLADASVGRDKCF